MKKYAYVVCSTVDGHFAEMAAISAASLQRTNPGARIIVVTDRETLATGTPGLAAMRSLGATILVSDAVQPSIIERSRYIKVKLRSLVDGDYVYLDSDTLILKDISAVWNMDAEIAGAEDLDPNGRPYLMSEDHRHAYKAMGWEALTQNHVNTGVLLIRDTVPVRTMMDQFYRDWLEYRRVTGKVNDQPTFNHTLRASEVRFRALPSAYNAQLVYDPRIATGAKVVHVFSGNFENRNDTILHGLARSLKQTGVIDFATIDRHCELGHVWPTIDSFRKAVATRNYPKAVVFGFRRVLGTLKAA